MSSNNGTKWTDQQREAIDARGKGVIVSAAAGSGKTAVLIERCIELLSDEAAAVPADTLLAVTFTNAAAAQLRDKLSTALSDKIAESADNEWLLQQQSSLQSAKIMTINAFCLDLVRSNVHTLGLQNGVRILEENDVEILTDEMFRRAVDDFYKDYAAETEKLTDLVFSSSDSLIESAKEVYRYIRSLPFSQSYIDKSIAELKSQKAAEKACAEILGTSLQVCRRVKALNEKAEILCNSLYQDAGIGDILDDDKAFIEKLISAVSLSDWDTSYTLLSQYKPKNNKPKLTEKSADKFESPMQFDSDKEARLLISSLRDEAKGLIKQLTEDVCCPFEEICKDCVLSAQLAETLFGIISHADELITAEKQSRNGCDFADVELMTVRLLCENENGRLKRTRLCEELAASGEFGIILIDEFQDINNLQEIIFKCISDTDDLDISGKNVFAVGDIKQAIYGFRLSNPKLFSKARENARSPEYKDSLKEIVLSKNFRSRQSVIDFANFLFSHLMSREVGGVDYTKSEQLYAGACYDGEDAPTEIALFDGDEQAAVAGKIRSMIDAETPVFENGKSRPCRPSDFCVLTRNKTQNALFSAAFEKQGLKMSCREIDGYLKSREISLMTSLLKIIDKPMNDIAMLSVMLSPIFGFSDDQAASLKSGRTRGDKLYTLMAKAEKSELDISLKVKCRETLEKISLFRYYASAMSIEQLIRRLFIETDFYILTASFSGGERAQANLRLLLELASDYDKGSGGGLTGFLRYLDGVVKNKKDFKQAVTVTEENDAVNVMTMHKSKGLEFPFVFLSCLKTEFRFDDKAPVVLDESGIGIRITNRKLFARYPTAPYTAISAHKRKDTISEEMRLFYVAVTRAKERLIITLPKDLPSQAASRTSKMLEDAATVGCITPETALSAKSMLDWVLTACAFSSDCDRLIKQLGLPDNVRPTDKSCRITVSEIVDDKKDEAFRTAEKSEELDKELFTQLEALLAQSAPNSSGDLAKVSVTEISHRDSAPFYPQIPNFSGKKDGFSSAERGTLTHRFMELCDFKAACRSVDKELDRLLSLGRFSEKEAAGIYTEALKKFFCGDLAKKMLQSENMMREKQFMIKLCDLPLSRERFGEYASSGGMIQGIADCIFEDDDGYTIVDYKTDRVETPEQLTERYSLQLELYRKAFSVLLDRPVTKCVIYSFWLGKAIEL